MSVRHIDSARLMPIALTLMRTSCEPGAGTVVSTNSRTSGPPAFANLMVRDMFGSSWDRWVKSGASSFIPFRRLTCVIGRVVRFVAALDHGDDATRSALPDATRADDGCRIAQERLVSRFLRKEVAEGCANA